MKLKEILNLFGQITIVILFFYLLKKTFNNYTSVKPYRENFSIDGDSDSDSDSNNMSLLGNEECKKAKKKVLKKKKNEFKEKKKEYADLKKLLEKVEEAIEDESEEEEKEELILAKNDVKGVIKFTKDSIKLYKQNFESCNINIGSESESESDSDSEYW